jgi:methylase of polypeptide subunit release factors
MVDRPCSSDRACEILESGVGAGRIAISLAKPGFSVIDIDISKAMPEITNENFDRWEHSRGSFVFKEGYMATFDCRIAISVWSLSGETLF